MIYFCCEEGRRSLVRAHAMLNGIDYLEVVHREETNPAEQQRKLRVFFVKAAAATLHARFPSATTAQRIGNAAMVKVTGGERVQKIQVDYAAWKTVTLLLPEHLEVHVTPRGDYSRYTLRLVEPNTDTPLVQLDAQLARVDFSFKVECESDFDCRPACACPSPASSSPDLDYLAKDYASFRQLLLDRLAVLAPNWRERNPADLGITLVELLAYAGDYLSYRQDAIATEAYLGTARRRASVRRHTRLLDYAMHDGCNARAWVQVRLRLQPMVQTRVVLPPFYVVNSLGAFLRADGTLPVLAAGSGEAVRRPRFVTRLAGSPVLAEHEFQRLAGATSVEVFEPMEAAELFVEHNEMQFHTWGDAFCCVPKGATKATLRGHFPNLQPGFVLVFAEQIGPRTGNPADADPARRYAVRLTKVNGLDRKEYFEAKQSNTFPQQADPLFKPPRAITDIEWAEGDALPFPFCVSARAEIGGRLFEDLSVALGNIVAADHGMMLPAPERLPEVPSPNPVLAPVATGNCGPCETQERLTAPPRYRPRLGQRPLTHAAPYDSSASATEAFAWGLGDASPCVRLADNQGRVWLPKRDLLSSDAFAPEFVVEVENDGRALIRFGDDESGLAPGEGTRFDAVYRIGNGARGNLGTEALVHLVTDVVLVPDSIGKLQPQPPASLIESVSNPLPARRGTDPETLEEVRQNAPAAFRVQQRAVTPDDYAEKAGEHPDVQRAAATLRWTGSWHTIFLTVDRRGGGLVDAAFETGLRAHLERYRLAGHDLEIDGPRYVSLELEVRVCVAADYFRNDVVAALQTVFDNRLHADGSRGFFHPDNFTFGQPVLLSRIYAAAQPVAGVRHVEVTLLRRQGATTGELVPASDVFDVGRLEIVRLDHDPNFPDRGVLRFQPLGGR